MKAIVAVLLLLAAGKVGYQHYLAASAKSEIIIAAYRERAVSACERSALRSRMTLAPAWARHREAQLVIGKSSLDVPLWQFENRLWKARYKNPYLLMTLSTAPREIVCEFDIVQGVAVLQSL